MRLFNHPAPGIGVLMPGQFAVPQNPLRPATYRPTIGEFMAARFTVPQNPILDAVASGDIGRPQTGPGAAWRRLKNGGGMGCASCGGGCNGSGGGGGCGCSGGMKLTGPGLVGLSGLAGDVLGVDTDALGTTIGDTWDQLTQFKVAGVPVVYLVGGWLAYSFLFGQKATGYRPSRYERARRRLAAAAS